MNIDEIIDKIDSGQIKLHDIEKFTSYDESVDIRRMYLETKLNYKFESVSNFVFDAGKIYGRNCENLIGGVSIPVGVAGPIKILGQNAHGEYFVPIATTEGALIASVNRGSKLIYMVGGVNVISKYVGITRAPVYKLPSLRKAHEFIQWFEKNKDIVYQIGDNTDNFLKVIKSKVYSNGRYVWIRFSFNTKDAMGMNMAVIASKTMSDYMMSKFEGLRTISISGNMCVDKKAASINSTEGRGRTVEAELVIPRNILQDKFQTTPENLVEVNKAKIWLGGHMAGSIAFNAHFANMVAGIFIATGQDPAQVVGGSLGSTNMEMDGENLYVNVRIPSLNVATVGGGTSLPTQRELQNLIMTNTSDILKEDENPEKIDDIDKTQKLAEIIGGAVLAGELSLHIAFANDGFVKAHTDLGRNGKI